MTTTIRIFFEKRGEAAYISLLDLQRVFHRLLKISGLPVWYTLGFNPHIYLAFSCPLSLGQESLCESCEVKTEADASTLDFEEWKNTLNPIMPKGIVVTKVAPANRKMGEICSASYRFTMPAASAAAVDTYNAMESAAVTKKTKRGHKDLELKEYIPHIAYTVAGDELIYDLTLPSGSGENLNLNPALLLNFLQEHGGPAPWQCTVLRTQLYTKNNAEFC